jgi:hypothetical protein
VSELVLYARADQWLRLLCQGWRLPERGGWLGSYHGRYSVLLTREAADA